MIEVDVVLGRLFGMPGQPRSLHVHGVAILRDDQLVRKGLALDGRPDALRQAEGRDRLEDQPGRMNPSASGAAVGVVGLFSVDAGRPSASPARSPRSSAAASSSTAASVARAIARETACCLIERLRATWSRTSERAARCRVSSRIPDSRDLQVPALLVTLGIELASVAELLPMAERASGSFDSGRTWA